MSNQRRERLVFNYPLPDDWYRAGAEYEQPKRYSAAATDGSSYNYYAHQATPRRYTTSDPQCISPQMLQISPSSSYTSSNGSHYARQYTFDSTGRHSNSSFGTTPPSPMSVNEDQYRTSGTRDMSYSPRDSGLDTRYINSSGYEFEVTSNTSRKASASKRPECPYEDCLNSSGRRSSFSRPADLKRHIDSCHGSKKTIDCTFGRCQRKGEQGFARRDHFVEHMRGFHKIDLPKRVTRS